MSFDSVLNTIIPPVVILIGFYLMFRPLKNVFVGLYHKAADMMSGAKKERATTTIQYE
jgi:hypothetical protein